MTVIELRAMSDDGRASDRPSSSTLAAAPDIQVHWDAFRKGAVVPCPADAAPLALSVDGATGVYRFVCTRCGLASPWFDSGTGGVRVRAHSHEGEHGGASGT
jgi:hypothetical protein